MRRVIEKLGKKTDEKPEKKTEKPAKDESHAKIAPSTATKEKPMPVKTMEPSTSLSDKQKVTQSKRNKYSSSSSSSASDDMPTARTTRGKMQPVSNVYTKMTPVERAKTAMMKREKVAFDKATKVQKAGESNSSKKEGAASLYRAWETLPPSTTSEQFQRSTTIIGRGAFATVERVTHRPTRQQYAMRIVAKSSQQYARTFSNRTNVAHEKDVIETEDGERALGVVESSELANSPFRP